ncbi:hypothetical protein NHX12_027032 [Muraenolepis orangiensis]|uniref:Uncharacterized protein n=1 Tax=Muraenolepis orangiensis TaxID=630683 RepID=A0A9Q0EFW3_9TELE|nr:hypothetical protein NHX12_027032 [Muraenolepis orangiensis]
MAAILDITPPSPLEGPDVSHEYDGALSPVHGSPAHGPASRPSLAPIQSLPAILSAVNPNLLLARPPSNGGKKNVCQSKLRAKVKKLEKENLKLIAELDGIRKVNSKMRVQMHRWSKSKETVRQVTMTTDSPVQAMSPVPPSTDEEGDQDVLEVGRFVIVKYDEKRYVGQILNIQGEEIQHIIKSPSVGEIHELPR